MKSNESPKGCEKVVEVILAFSEECADHIDSKIVDLVPDEKKRQKIRLAVLCEYIYFYMHMITRVIKPRITMSEFGECKNRISVSVVRYILDTYFSYVSTDDHRQVSAEFYKNLNIAENDYGLSKELMNDAKPLSGNGAFSILGRSVAEAATSNGNPIIMLDAIGIATSSFHLIDIENLAYEVKREFQSAPAIDAEAMYQQGLEALKKGNTKAALDIYQTIKRVNVPLANRFFHEIYKN